MSTSGGTLEPDGPGLGIFTASGVDVGAVGTLAGAVAEGNGNLFFVPFFSPKGGLLVAQMACDVTVAGTAGSAIRLGIYDDGGAFAPSALLLDAGQIATGVTTGRQSITGLSTQLAAGKLYWLACVTQGAPVTTPTLACIAPAGAQYSAAGAPDNAYFQLGVTAALPGVASGLNRNVSAPAVLVHT